MSTLIKQHFGDYRTGEATVILIDTKDGNYIIGRYLPAGMDIAPSFYKYLQGDETSALRRFKAICCAVESMGFEKQA